MKIPFTKEAFFQVFADYNTAVWPMQLVLLALAVFWFIRLMRGHSEQGRWIFATLMLFWLWMGIVYHVLFFWRINPVALWFGILFVAQGLAMLYHITQAGWHVQLTHSWKAWAGMMLIFYALALYPLLGYLMGHRYPTAPTFGVPCPTTIFTLGVLMLVKEKLPWFAYVIPVLWSLIGFSAALNLGVYEDMGLVLAGVVFIASRVGDKSPAVAHS